MCLQTSSFVSKSYYLQKDKNLITSLNIVTTALIPPMSLEHYVKDYLLCSDDSRDATHRIFPQNRCRS